MKNLKSYLESRHQNASVYVVKTQKSIVNMLIVDMRICDKYTNTHKISFYTKKALERSSFMQKSDLGELPVHDMAFRLPPAFYQVT